MLDKFLRLATTYLDENHRQGTISDRIKVKIASIARVRMTDEIEFGLDAP